MSSTVCIYLVEVINLKTKSESSHILVSSSVNVMYEKYAIQDINKSLSLMNWFL